MFLMKLQSSTLSKKSFRHRWFFVNSAKVLIKPFLKIPSDSFFQRNLVPFQKRCHTYLPAEYFLGLICRLGTRVSSIFQTHSQKSLFSTRRAFFMELFPKIVNTLKLLSIFPKKSIVDVWPGSKYASVRRHYKV